MVIIKEILNFVRGEGERVGKVDDEWGQLTTNLLN